MILRKSPPEFHLNHSTLARSGQSSYGQSSYDHMTITRLLDNAAFVCVHAVGRFSEEFSEVHGLRSREKNNG